MRDDQGVPLCPDCEDYYADDPTYGRFSSCRHSRPSDRIDLLSLADSLAEAARQYRLGIGLYEKTSKDLDEALAAWDVARTGVNR